MNFFWPKQPGEWKFIIDSVYKASPLSPFHTEVLNFLQTVSKVILKDHSYRKHPELIALAYWLRKAHLKEMQDAFQEKTAGKLLLAKGTSLHFSPSNVDTIFVYSWVLSMLAGNKNMIRISGRKQDQTDLLLQALIKGLESYPVIGERTAIFTYDHQDEYTLYLSERCHTRVIWGGDQTVKTIRSVPLAPLASEMAFPDRFSLAAIDAGSILECSEPGFDEAIHRFYNDSYWFGQMACSSPRLIVWTGDKDQILQAQERFWPALNQFLKKKDEELYAALQVQKLTTGYLLSTDKDAIHFDHSSHFSRLKLTAIGEGVREQHCGGGLFLELEIQQLDELIPYLADKDQTLSYYGYTKEQLQEFAQKLVNRGIDRIVPFGQALDFEGVWDGNDLIMNFTREIVIR